MATDKTTQRLIELINSGKKYPAVSLVNKSPEIAAIVSKLVKKRDHIRTDPTNPNSYYNLRQDKLLEISSDIQEKIKATDNTIALFPDLELAAQILITSILSPKDMVNTNILYQVSESLTSSELTAKLLDIVKNECEKSYDLSNKLTDILREVLFETGSYVLAVLPESSVDELINGNNAVSLEGISEIVNSDSSIVNLGILGSPTKKPTINKGLALESFGSIFTNEAIENIVTDGNNAIPLLKLEVTDNFKLLKLPKLMSINNKNRIDSKLKQYGISQEANVYNYPNKKITNDEAERLLYKGPNNKATPFTAIKTQEQSKRSSVGRPLVLKLPSEATIPVFVPGDEKNHIGYFILIDEEGNPLSKMSNNSHLDEMHLNLSNSSNSLSSFLLQKARSNLTGGSSLNLSIPLATQIYADIVETDLIQRLKNGIYGRKVKLSDNKDIYRIMLARSLANQYTKILYIPAELVTYFAIKYFDNGVGKSLLDDLKILTSLRGILLFSKVMAMTKNSIAVTHVNMTLDPNDPDPNKTIELAVHEIIKMRQQYFPLGINSPIDLVNWVQRAGFEFTFEGHPGLPQTKFDFDTKNIQHALPDNDLDELLRKQTLMAIGLSPEVVDNGFNAEFATTVVANNVLLSKRVTHLQNRFMPQVTDHVVKVLKNDNRIKLNCLQEIKDNKGLFEKMLSDEDKELYQHDENAAYNKFYNEFIETLELTLPRPDITSLQNQAEAFNEYSDSLDKTIDAFINSEFMTNELVGDISGLIDPIKTTFKAFFLRKWMAENGYMSELSDIVTTDEDGDAIINLQEIMTEHNEGLMRSSIEFIKALKTMRDAANKDLANMNVEPDNSASSYDNEETTDDSGGFDDFGSEAGLDETEIPPEETESEAVNDETEETEKPEETTTEK